MFETNVECGKAATLPVCALVGASDFNAEVFCEMDAASKFDYVIAVDAGFAHLEQIGRKPDMALGDFDSLGYVPKGVRVARFNSHKDKTDMELALERAHTLHYDSVVVFGALGGRLDHTMGNMQLFAKAAEDGFEIVAIDMESSVHFISGPDLLELPARESGTLSAISMSDVCEGVFERGLEWELDDVELTNRTSLGISNEFIGEAVMVGVERGTLAVFVSLA